MSGRDDSNKLARALALLRQGESALAYDSLRQTLEGFPEAKPGLSESEILILLAMAAEDAGRHEESRQLLRQSTMKSLESGEIRVQRNAFFQLGLVDLE